MIKNVMNYTIKINDKDYNVSIAKKRIKRLIIRIDYRLEILVSSPVTISYNDALNKVFLNSSWIEKQLKKHSDIIDEFSVNDFLDKKIIYILGNKYNIVQNSNLGSSFDLVGDTFFYKNNLKKTIDLIYSSYYFLLEDEFKKALNYFKNKIKQTPTLQIRKMKSRWGSCNYHTGQIVLNKMLISTPINLITYVIYHEFTHLIFPNHSKEFYNYLNSILSDYKMSEKKLKKYSFLLTN